MGEISQERVTAALLSMSKHLANVPRTGDRLAGAEESPPEEVAALAGLTFGMALALARPDLARILCRDFPIAAEVAGATVAQIDRLFGVKS